MDHPHTGSVSLPNFAGKSKILFSEWPGKVGLLIDGGKTKHKKFRDAHAALEWCEKNHATFYYLPPDSPEKN